MRILDPNDDYPCDLFPIQTAIVLSAQLGLRWLDNQPIWMLQINGELTTSVRSQLMAASSRNISHRLQGLRALELAQPAPDQVSHPLAMLPDGISMDLAFLLELGRPERNVHAQPKKTLTLKVNDVKTSPSGS
jgi:hypothetical protein